MLHIFLATDTYEEVYYRLIAVIYEYSYCSSLDAENLNNCRVL